MDEGLCETCYEIDDSYLCGFSARDYKYMISGVEKIENLKKETALADQLIRRAFIMLRTARPIRVVDEDDRLHRSYLPPPCPSCCKERETTGACASCGVQPASLWHVITPDHFRDICTCLSRIQRDRFESAGDAGMAAEVLAAAHPVDVGKDPLLAGSALVIERCEP